MQVLFNLFLTQRRSASISKTKIDIIMKTVLLESIDGQGLTFDDSILTATYTDIKLRNIVQLHQYGILKRLYHCMNPCVFKKNDPSPF